MIYMYPSEKDSENSENLVTSWVSKMYLLSEPLSVRSLLVITGASGDSTEK
jgi:hypothetical protein